LLISIIVSIMADCTKITPCLMASPLAGATRLTPVTAQFSLLARCAGNGRTIALIDFEDFRSSENCGERCGDLVWHDDFAREGHGTENFGRITQEATQLGQIVEY
jgi:hypothetical protein